MDFLIVGVGGFLGAISRYGIYLAQKSFYHGAFPVGTLIINASGCFLAGAVYTYFELKMPHARELQLLMMVGFLGSYTTFSTLALESFVLGQNQQIVTSFFSFLLNVSLGFFAVYIGRSLVFALK